MNPSQLAANIKRWAHELGFSATGIANVDISEDERYLNKWLAAGYQGEMDYMQRHGTKRSRPAELVPGTLSVVCVRMDYLSTAEDPEAVLSDSNSGYISRYALGRDYHKVLRNRLQKLAKKVEAEVGPFGYRAFTDSAPVLEKALARNAGLGWIGKHSNLIDARSGSFFFLGELYVDIELPEDKPQPENCGSCTACIPACPTGAIVAPYQVDARKCISYLTIELPGSIPEPLRPMIGNRVYGCDDCQLVCPWNKFAQLSDETDYQTRHDLDDQPLATLFGWSEQEFLQRTEGMAIRRIGYERWLRNIAVGLGNAPASEVNRAALQARVNDSSALVREHTHWALDRIGRAAPADNGNV